MNRPPLTIAVVGPCASGKSTLVSGLKKYGYKAKHVAQEHSFVPDMWKRMTDPDVLIYLEVSYQVSNQRSGSTLKESIFRKQENRLKHARDHADLVINTETLDPDQILQQVLEYL